MKYHAPLDPECPAVKSQRESMYSEESRAMCPGDVLDELFEDFEQKHRATCERCKQFGAANIEVV